MGVPKTSEEWDEVLKEDPKKPKRVRDMEDELPSGMKYVDNESNETEKEEADYWIGHNQKTSLKKEAHLIKTTVEANERADTRCSECRTAESRSPSKRQP